MDSNLLTKLVHNSRWLQQHEKFKKFCKFSLISIIKIVNGNKGLEKNVGLTGGTFRFDYAFVSSDFSGWGRGHNNGFETLLKVCEGRKVVFDIGAHIGLCSMPISNVIEEGGFVYAFEPATANQHYLLRNIHYSNINNIKLVPNLVGEESMENVPFYESYYVAGMNSVVPYKNDDTYQVTYKRQVSLDDFCADNRIIPEVIKIDVEGAEMKVLQGAKNVLKSYCPVIILSVHPKHLGLLGESVEDLKNLIASVGYKILGMNKQIVGDLDFEEYLLEHVL